MTWEFVVWVAAYLVGAVITAGVLDIMKGEPHTAGSEDERLFVVGIWPVLWFSVFGAATFYLAALLGRCLKRYLEKDV